LEFETHLDMASDERRLFMLAEMSPKLAATATPPRTPTTAMEHCVTRGAPRDTAMQKWRIVILGFGMARQKRVLE
jgi:hypothetical protein